jgi:glucokinase
VENPVLAVDIGGTKVAAGLLDRSGKILLTRRTPMSARGTAAEGLQSVFRALDAVRRDRRARNARAIGVCLPGWVDARRGTLVSAANIPCWREFPLRREIEKYSGLPVRIANDANAGALAEARWGAGAGAKIVFYVTLGTGIGTGLVINGRIYSGRAGGATEGGHTTIDLRGPNCGCGKRGCIEMYASGTAVGRRARDLLAKSAASATGGSKRRSQMLAFADGKMEAVTAQIVAKAAAAGDTQAREILEEAADYFAVWLGNMIDLLEPGVIVIGGGFSAVMMSEVGRIYQKLENWAGNPRARETQIVPARYGSESALVGAAALSMAP